jgi:hypothetical protein
MSKDVIYTYTTEMIIFLFLEMCVSAIHGMGCDRQATL